MAMILLLAAAIAPAIADRCEAAPRRAVPFAALTADSGKLFRGALSRDGKTLYYFKKVTPGGENYRIFVTRLDNGQWSAPEKLALGGDYSELYPSLSADGNRLVFSSYRPIPNDTFPHPNAHLWYVDRRGAGWGTPVFMAAASALGHYHSGPTIAPNGDVRFQRASPDFRTSTALITRWKDGSYQPAEVDVEMAPHREAFRPDYHIWAARWTPDRRGVLLEVARRDPLTGAPRDAELWFTTRRGAEWTAPRPLGAGVNTPATENFAFFSPDGCTLIFTRDFSAFQQVSWAAAMADSVPIAGRWQLPDPLRSTVPVVGSYRGAFIRDGSVQLVDAVITSVRDTLRLSMSTPDRLNPMPPVPISRVGGQLRFATGFGPAVARVDSVFGEIVGEVERDGVRTALHLKRSPLPAEPAVERREVTFAGVGGGTLAGTIVKPLGVPIRAAIAFVAGRGCVTRSGGQRLLELLAPYGIAGIAIDKRGVGQSTGNCPFATIQQFSDDALAALDQLRQAVDARTPVGFLGVSAGGWVSVHAASRATRPIDFLITNVGPATSVRQQQLDNATLIARRIGLTAEQTGRAQRYVELMFAKGAGKARYDEMMATVEWARGVGFADEFFETSDIPTSIGGLDSLWVQLNDYDPGPDLRKLRMPILAFFGGADEVVPADRNLAALRLLSDEAGNSRVRAVVVPDGDHGLVQAEGPGADGRWRFGRVSPLYIDEVVRFLRRL